MKVTKNNLKKSIAKSLINIGETGITTYSFFINWYEPKVSSNLLKKLNKK